ncbi:unnamed protein product [Medioppia subpectinata]|uniref:Uncharacterized protein n=1 Tax=Medioppia subpectinata TaxID=1979941 RepID=A0A7R9KSG2_9ACAR|nr:unnamed protein product [Medioppia subpectinata]CAG2107778.1 unnamed protein product [Medioppia subpectinata]
MMAIILLVTTMLQLPAPTHQGYEEDLRADFRVTLHVDDSELYGDGDEAMRSQFLDEDKFAKSMCPVGEDDCHENAMLQAAPDTKTPAEKIKEKLNRHKQYEKAMKDGEAQAQKELKAAGKADEWGGFLPPNMIKGTTLTQTNETKAGSKPRANAHAKGAPKKGNPKKGKGKEGKSDEKEDKVLKAEKPEEETEDKALKAEKPEEKTEDKALKAEKPEEKPEDKALKAEKPEEKTEDKALKAEKPEEKTEDKALKAEKPEEKTEDKALKAEKPEEKKEDKVLKAEKKDEKKAEKKADKKEKKDEKKEKKDEKKDKKEEKKADKKVEKKDDKKDDKKAGKGVKVEVKVKNIVIHQQLTMVETRTRMMASILLVTTMLQLPAPTHQNYEAEIMAEIRGNMHPRGHNELSEWDDEPYRVRSYWADDDEDSMLQAAPGGNKKQAEKQKRDQQYEKAMKDGESHAHKDLKAAGGADPYGGFLLPQTDDGKHPHKAGSKPRANAHAKGPPKKGKGKGGKSGKINDDGDEVEISMS